MKRVSIAVVCDGPSDSTSFYRALGPLGTLARTVAWLELTMYSEWTWASFKMIDAVFVQRPFSPEHLRIIRMAKLNAKKVWLDYDDYLLDVPLENPLSRLYSQHVDGLRAILKLADVITVSTEYLKKLLVKETSAEIVVVPNALDDTLFSWRAKNSTVRAPLPVVAWRGSDTHINDLMEVKDGFAEAARRLCPPWQFHFWGYRPFFIWKEVEKHGPAIHHGLTDIVSYHNAFASTTPGIVVVPLSDNDFNRSKSNCAWIEATLAGAVVVAPNWPEWRRPGIVNYENPPEFAPILIKVANMTESERIKLNADSWREVQDRHLLTKVNNQRISVLDKLVK